MKLIKVGTPVAQGKLVHKVSYVAGGEQAEDKEHYHFFVFRVACCDETIHVADEEEVPVEMNVTTCLECLAR